MIPSMEEMAGKEEDLCKMLPTGPGSSQWSLHTKGGCQWRAQKQGGGGSHSGATGWNRKGEGK